MFRAGYAVTRRAVAGRSKVWLNTYAVVRGGATSKTRSYSPLFQSLPSLTVPRFRLQIARALSSKQKGEEGAKTGDAEGESKEIVLTPGQKVVAASRLSMWAAIAAFAAVCGFYIVKELMPT